jgi:hypothetical protein
MRLQKQIVYVIKERIIKRNLGFEDFLRGICRTLKGAKDEIKKLKIKSIFIKPLFFIEKMEVKG